VVRGRLTPPVVGMAVCAVAKPSGSMPVFSVDGSCPTGLVGVTTPLPSGFDAVGF